MRTQGCRTRLMIVLCVAAVHAGSPSLNADLHIPVESPDATPDLLERRLRAHAEEVRQLEEAYKPAADVAPPLIPKYIFWPAFGLFNVALIVCWLLVARYWQPDSRGTAILLAGLSRRRRRRPARAVAAVRSDPGAIQSLLSLLGHRRRHRHRHHRNMLPGREGHRRHRHAHHHRHRRHHRSSAHRSHPPRLQEDNPEGYHAPARHGSWRGYDSPSRTSPAC